MALKNVIDPAHATESVRTWLAGRTGADDVVVSDVRTPQASGMSNETLVFDASWTAADGPQSGSYVARVQPLDGAGVFRHYDLERETRVLKALLEHSSVPVPAVLFLEPDAAVLGAPFFMMERLDGRVPADDPPFTVAGWFTELSADQRRTLYQGTIATIAAVHTMDWNAAGLGDLDRRDLGADPLAQQLAEWREYRTWAAAGRPTPVIDAALDWLDEHRPAAGPTVLNWGDARIGNILFGDDQSVSGALDWEMAGVGHPELDIAWDLFVLEHNTAGIGALRPEGCPTVEDVRAQYEELTGYPLPHLDYYRIFSAMRYSCFMVRAAALMVAAGLLSSDTLLADVNPATQILSESIGFGVLAGQAESYFGSR